MAEAAGGTAKPNVDRETIAVTIKSQDGKNTSFRMKRDKKLKKPLLAYCEKRFVDYSLTKFMIDGSPFSHNKSPNELELEDSVEIEAMVESGPSKKKDDKIIIYVQGPDGIQVQFAVNCHLPLKRLMMKYCEHKKLDYSSMRFIYNYSRLPVRRTPNELHMEDGDQIDAVVEGHSG